MKISDTIDGLVHIPREYYSKDTVSFLQLLKDTGYWDVHDQISVEDIREALTRDPECVDEWIQYSEDQRTDAGWCINEMENKKYVVRYKIRDAHFVTHGEYGDRLEACAVYIKLEIEDTRTMFP